MKITYTVAPQTRNNNKSPQVRRYIFYCLLSLSLSLNYPPVVRATDNFPIKTAECVV